MSEVLVNGPVNVMRLEGLIDNVKKILYVFFDIHLDVSHELPCKSFTAKDITYYLKENFTNTTKTIDFLFESNETIFAHSTTPYRGKYIEQVSKLFREGFRSKSPMANIRMHYVDIREYFFETIYRHIDELFENKNRLSDNFHPDNFSNYINTLDTLRAEYEFWYKIFSNDDVQIKKETIKHLARLKREELNKFKVSIPKFVEKIKGKYSNPENREKLNDMFGFFTGNLKKILSVIDEAKQYAVKMSEKFKAGSNVLREFDESNTGTYMFYGYSTFDTLDFSSAISKHVYIIEDYHMNGFATLMDIFFVRRFVDKPYITHAVSYTGGQHSVHIIHHLVSKYNFSITHAAYVKNNIKELETVIKTTKIAEVKHNLSGLMYPPILSQCSNMTEFPKNFD